MMSKWKIYVAMLTLPLAIVACGDDDDDEPVACSGGNSVITGHVTHHDDEIPGSTVFLKCNATEFPGTNPALYDQTLQASADDGHYTISALSPGNYYLFAAGFDSAIVDSVFGGIPIVIDTDPQTIDINIPVTE